MSIEYAIVCDGCDRLLCASRQSAANARAQLHRNGGRTGGGRDLCPECVADRKRPS